MQSETVPALDGLTIRAAGMGDLPVLAARDIDRLGQLYDRLERHEADRGELLIALIAGRPVGHIYLWREDAEEPELREHLPAVPLIMNLWVSDDHRRQGIGKELVARAEADLSGAGHREVALGVHPDNTDAIKLYLSLGYEQWGYGQIATCKEPARAGKERFANDICEIYVKRLNG
ncbi:hypothetical protein GCM10009765_46050 [Fodinicola feengrottensis]|uniref:N-acetyltransferase domain-containing protein n=1 Tax=Fodinicola feengrottensis TaxID=435914 RepID=A0ABN2HPV8_9ACTN